MEEMFRIKIRALEEENERLKAENKRLRNNSGGSTGISKTSFEGDDGFDDNSFEAWTVGSVSSLSNPTLAKDIKPRPVAWPTPDPRPFRVSARFKSFGFGLERLERISKARVDQIWIEGIN